jgi:hypothetical protein
VSDVTPILDRVQQGDGKAAEEMVPLGSEPFIGSSKKDQPQPIRALFGRGNRAQRSVLTIPK